LGESKPFPDVSYSVTHSANHSAAIFTVNAAGAICKFPLQSELFRYVHVQERHQREEARKAHR
jgi:hypothetical protein